MNTETQSEMVKCTCNNCSQHFEFERERAGETIACPHCGMDTKLFVPHVSSAKLSPPRSLPPPPPFKPIRIHVGFFGVVFVGLLGGGLFLNGCINEDESKTVMQQTVAVLQYCTGLLLVGIAFILEALHDLSGKQ